ncbi:hypothetical protein HDU96_011040 [Phlyctochytrium bullatum]|nr:hypothetical protein HDU96_011040 [Phlyctochytrium bullatum]
MTGCAGMGSGGIITQATLFGLAAPMIAMDDLLSKNILDELQLGMFGSINIYAVLRVITPPSRPTKLSLKNRNPTMSPDDIYPLKTTIDGEDLDDDAMAATRQTFSGGLCHAFSLSAYYGALLHLSVPMVQCLTTLTPFLLISCHPHRPIFSPISFLSSGLRGILLFAVTVFGIVLAAGGEPLESVGTMALVFSVGFEIMHRPWIAGIAKAREADGESSLNRAALKVWEMAMGSFVGSTATIAVSYVSEAPSEYYEALLTTEALPWILSAAVFSLFRLAVTVQLADPALPTYASALHISFSSILSFVGSHLLFPRHEAYSSDFGFVLSLCTSTLYHLLVSAPLSPPSGSAHLLFPATTSTSFVRIPRLSRPIRTVLLGLTVGAALACTLKALDALVPHREPYQPEFGVSKGGGGGEGRDAFAAEPHLHDMPLTEQRRWLMEKLRRIGHSFDSGVVAGSSANGSERSRQRKKEEEEGIMTLHIVLSSAAGNVTRLTNYVRRIEASAAEYLRPFTEHHLPHVHRGDDPQHGGSREVKRRPGKGLEKDDQVLEGEIEHVEGGWLQAIVAGRKDAEHRPHPSMKAHRIKLRITVLVPSNATWGLESLLNSQKSSPNQPPSQGKPGITDIIPFPPDRLEGSRSILRFLVTHYHDLETWTAFLGPDDEDAQVLDLDGFFSSVKETTAFGLVDGFFNSCDCAGGDCSEATAGALVQIWAMAQRTFCPESGVAVQSSRNFFASRHRIHHLPLSTYKYLYTYSTIADFQKIPEGSSLLPADEVMDLAWPVLFRCARAGMVDQCRMDKKCTCEEEEEELKKGLGAS